ncbi:hypothetical protein K1T71_006909 [Dendrolimus kikuchii]|uniref:Uncharacterized protein n=1 Tax=Dendrolimus kikuchii TaxID=765133 RepID=A0ACC1CZI4_9NEOP|nr:hypothetical protein K1T71_006909 [Dendrolimus kikuchii]
MRGNDACGWCAGRVLNVAAALLLGAGLPAPCAGPRPCAPGSPSALCLCRPDQLSCSHVPFHRFPETEAGVRHVAVDGARLGALGEAALDARALRTLVLVGSHLHHIEPRALASMASSLASLDLGYNEFMEVPIEALRELKVLNWLNLQNNFIMDLYVNVDWGHLTESLSTLSLSNNRVSALDEGALSGLHHLAQLELDGNQLHALAAGALPPSVALLRLADNLLTHIPCTLFAQLRRLRHLNVRNNMLNAQSNGTCKGEHSRIDSLDLSSNELDDRFELVFQGGLQLKQLVLDSNEFTAIPAFVADSGRLQKLSLSYNRLGRISDVVVRGVKADLVQLDLDHNELTMIPQSVVEMLRLRHLSLAYNYLVELDHLPPHLHTLSLAGNYFLNFPMALRDLAPVTLVYLDIGYNQISVLTPDVFGTWSEALTTLNLKGNRITQLSAEVFPVTLPLRELILSFNDLYYVDPNTFANLTLVQVLELSSTLFNGEIPNMFPLDRLSWLSLDNNNIHFLSSEELLSFSSLEYLNLDFNKIVQFPSETSFAGDRFYSLKELRLAYNYLIKFNSDFLMYLPELQSLDLSYNRLHNIAEHSFVALSNLVYLSLAGNMLESVEPGAFRDLPKIEVLDVHGNHLLEFSTEYFENVSNELTNFSVNASYNRIASVEGAGKSVVINILDLSHNVLETISAAFIESVGPFLRQLILSYNRLTHIDGTRFGAIPNLEILDLQYNNISAMKKKYFADTTTVQIFDLSNNRLAQLSVEQFHNMRRLRQLHLNSNELRSLPRDSFKNTILEHLDLSNNQLTIFPSSTLSQVGFTLRRLELAFNRLEYLDAAMFHSIAFLQELSLARNALTVLPDNTFAGLSHLRRLDLSYNIIKTNFKELFHNLPRLRYLSLAGCGLKTMPNLLLANLTELDLSGNYIASYRDTDVRRLANLRVLDLAGNKFTSLQPAMWVGMRRLTSLDVSHNPVVRVRRGSFEGLDRLLGLRMNHLRHLEAVEPRAFRPLSSLRSLELESPLVTVPVPGRNEVTLSEIVDATPALESLTVHVRDNVLDGQLYGVRVAKLRVLEVRGTSLRRISERAFASLGRQRVLAVRLTGTGVRDLPAGLLRPLVRVPHLALDLTDNRIEAFGPATLYPNLTGWNRIATKLLPGGLALSANPLRCGCAVAWVGAWLRRWTAEVGGGAVAAREAARAPLCRAPHGAASLPLLALAPDEAECHASALSKRDREEDAYADPTRRRRTGGRRRRYANLFLP